MDTLTQYVIAENKFNSFKEIIPNIYYGCNYNYPN